MALRDQPYIPLYVQDVLTDEKLIECSAQTHGVYFLLLCILHKQDQYGLLCLKQKYQQNKEQVLNFASMLARQMPFSEQVISSSLSELVEESVIIIHGNTLFQKRMVRDGELSLIRATSGKKGTTPLTKQYGKNGFLYLMSDYQESHKIGISTNPQNRLYRLRSDLNLSKGFSIIESIPVDDMGNSEDEAIAFFGSRMSGEWIKDSISNIERDFALLKAKLQAKQSAKTISNTEIEIENEIAVEKKKIIVVDVKTLSGKIEAVLFAGLNDIYIDQQRTKWAHVEFDFELTSFKEKVRGCPEDYFNHDTNGIRKAFQYQLRFAKSKSSTNGQGTNPKQQHARKAAETIAETYRDQFKPS